MLEPIVGEFHEVRNDVSLAHTPNTKSYTHAGFQSDFSNNLVLPTRWHYKYSRKQRKPLNCIMQTDLFVFVCIQSSASRK